MRARRRPAVGGQGQQQSQMVLTEEFAVLTISCAMSYQGQRLTEKEPPATLAQGAGSGADLLVRMTDFDDRCPR